MLLQLPKDITVTILASLSIQELGIVSLTSKELCKLIYSYDIIWKREFERQYGGPIFLEPPTRSQRNFLPSCSYRFSTLVAFSQFKLPNLPAVFAFNEHRQAKVDSTQFCRVRLTIIMTFQDNCLLEVQSTCCPI